MATIDEIIGTDLSHPVAGGFGVAADGDIDIVTGIANIQQALMRRLVTSKGSLAHRPDYGVGVKDFLNSPNSLENQRALATRVKEQFERDDRIEEVTGLRVETNSDSPSKVIIYVRVKIAGYNEQVLEFVPFGETVNG